MTTLQRLLITLLFLVSVLALVAVAMTPTAAPGGSAPQAQEFSRVRELAEAQIEQKSWRNALDLYKGIEREGLSEEEARWLDFRLSDLRWRDAAATQDSDDSVMLAARKGLQKLIQVGDERAEERDEVWVLVHESLGDSYWRSNDWGNSWPHFEKAFAYWSKARDIEKARTHYLALVDRIVRPDWGQSNWQRIGQYSNLPIRYVEDAAATVAVETADRSRMKYYLVQSLQRNGWSWSQSERVVALYEELEELGDVGPWYDDSLYAYGSWLQTQGRPQVTENGGYEMVHDYLGAIEIYKKLAALPKERTSHGRHAGEQIKRIRAENLSISVPHSYLPGSVIPIQVHWRNVEAIEFLMYPVDLTSAVRTDVKNHGPYQWLGTIDLSGLSAAHRFSHETGDTGEHFPGNAVVRAPKDEIAPGAYVLVAKAGVQTARELVLVTDASIIARVSETEAVFWVTDALTGEPLAGARVTWWERDRDNKENQGAAVSDESGLVRFPLASATQSRGSAQLFVAARIVAEEDGADSREREAFATTGTPWINRQTNKEWRFDVWTDRSTYKPGHEVQWKLLARVRDMEKWTTPANAAIEFEIYDPRSTSVLKEETTLNEFGTAIGHIEAGADWVLGEYRIEIRSIRGSKRDSLGSATLFRLEEYKVPDFEVRVLPVPKEGDSSSYRPGDRVEASIEASLYSGGPVVSADVTVVIERKAFGMTWDEKSEFGWLYEESNQNYGYGDWGWENVSQEELKTDEDGRAKVAFESPSDLGGDFEFRITARVVDSSRREVSGSGKVRVTQLGHFARVTSKKNLLSPGLEARFEFETRDQNGEVLGGIEGTATLFRLKQREYWIDPHGRRFDAPEDGRYPQKIEERETVALTRVITAAEGTDAGTAEWKVAIENEGRYVVHWRSFDDRGLPVEAEAMVWVASENTKELDWTGDGVQIVVDDDAFQMGQKAPWLVTTPASGRWVLTFVEAREFLDVRVERHQGTAKLYSIDLREEHVPNVFLSVYSTHRGSVNSDVAEIMVPPVEQFLDVSLAPESESYLPGSPGKFTLVAKDHAGNPVQAEFSIAVADAALAAIQSDYAKDPRKVYYGEKRYLQISTAFSLQLKQLVDLQTEEDVEALVDRLAFASTDGPFRDDALNDAIGIGGGAGAYGYVQELRSAKSASRLRAPSAPGRGGPSSPGPMGRMQAESMAVAEEAADLGDFRQGDSVAGAAGGSGEIRVRSDFRETAAWAPRVVTDAEGRAELELEFPDNLTRWNATAIGTTTGSRFGLARSQTKTNQPLTVRLQAPRFFVKKDICLISGVFRNASDEPLTVTPTLDIDDSLSLGRMRGRQFNHGAPGNRLPLSIAAGGEERIDWWVYVKSGEETTMRVTAASDAFSDAEERTFPVYSHGVDTLAAVTGRLGKGEQGDGANTLRLELDLPAQRDMWGTRMRIQVAPSLAVTMLDALPYLIEFPYGCTEQTLSRFVPAAIVANTLSSRGLDAETAMSRAFGGIEPDSADETRVGDPSKRVGLEQLEEVTAAGLERLATMQKSDGGWGWWSSSTSEPFMTAYVVWGLALAQRANVDIPEAMLDRGAEYLRTRLFEAENRVDLQAWMLHALGAYSSLRENKLGSDETVRLAFENCFEKRGGLRAYGTALLALAAHDLQRAEQATVLAENLRNGVKIDESVDSSVVAGVQGGGSAPARAHWGADGVWHHWSQSPVETTATALRALLAIKPDSELVDQVATWLVTNRRAAQWSNTRDTAMCVLALNQLLETTGELDRSVAYRVLLNGDEIAAVALSPEERLSAPSVFAIDPETVGRTENVIEVIRTEGIDSLDVAAYAEFFTNEEPVPARGSEIFVRREYFKLVPRPTLLAGVVYDRVPLEDRGMIVSGQRVEVVCTVEAKNDLEYLIFEDLKPAGFEAVQVKSGSPLTLRELKSSEVAERFGEGEDAAKRGRIGELGNAPGFTGRRRNAHVEWRERKVACFVDSLPEGIWQYSVTLRAEVPGQFHALPLLSHAMYVPEIRGNSAETRVLVEDRD